MINMCVHRHPQLLHRLSYRSRRGGDTRHEVRHAWADQGIVGMDVEQCCAHPQISDMVGKLAWYALDQAVQPQAAQVVSGPARGTFTGRSRLGAKLAAELPRAYYPWQDRQNDKRMHQAMHAMIAEAQTSNTGAG